MMGIKYDAVCEAWESLAQSIITRMRKAMRVASQGVFWIEQTISF